MTRNRVVKDTIKPITLLMIKAHIKKDKIVEVLSDCFDRPIETIKQVYTSVHRTYVRGLATTKIITRYEIKNALSKLESHTCNCADILKEELLDVHN